MERREVRTLIEEVFEEMIAEKECPKCEGWRPMLRWADKTVAKLRCMGCLKVWTEKLEEVKDEK